MVVRAELTAPECVHPAGLLGPPITVLITVLIWRAACDFKRGDAGLLGLRAGDAVRGRGGGHGGGRGPGPAAVRDAGRRPDRAEGVSGPGRGRRTAAAPSLCHVNKRVCSATLRGRVLQLYVMYDQARY